MLIPKLCRHVIISVMKIKALKEIRRDNLLRLINEHGSQKNLADALDIEPSQISQIKNGVRDVGEKLARKIEERLSLRTGEMDNILHKSKDVMDEYNKATYTERFKHKARTAMGEMSNTDKMEVLSLLVAQDCNSVAIPILDIEASGGMGSLNGSELTKDYMTVEKSYLGGFGLPTDNLKIITIRGDSMEPELTTGDLVLVHRVPIPVEKLHDGMFVVLIDDLLYIKRLQRLPGKKIKVISSNRDAYDPFTVDAIDLSIIGRVVFAWRGKKF